MTFNFEKDIIKQFGNVFKSGKSVIDDKPTIIPVSPAIDIGLHGGIVDGNFITLGALPKFGKTTLALHMAANAQKPEYAHKDHPEGRHIFYINAENRLKSRDLEGIKHLDITRFHNITSTAKDKDGSGGKILNAQENLEIAERILNEVPGAILIIDSYSSLVTADEMEGSMSDMQRCSGAKLMYKFCRKTSGVVSVNKSIVIGIIHLTASPTGYTGLNEGGGFGIKYAVDGKLIGKGMTYWKLNESEAPIGQQITWHVGCSPLGAPGASIESWIRYGEGIDCEKELIEIASNLGIINKAGSWFSIADKKVQGAEKVRALLLEDRELYNKIYKEVRETLGLKS